MVSFLLAAGCQAAPPPPSVLLVVVDTLRADMVGPDAAPTAGGRAAQRLPERTFTPAIDRWSTGAVRFRRATTPAPFTMPAMASLLSGAWPDRTGVVAHEPGSTLAAWPGATLAEAASRSGMATAAVVANPWLARASTGFDRGFTEFSRLYHPGESPGSSDAAAVTDDTIRILDALRGRRFFVWAHYFDPHMPYDPPPRFARDAGASSGPSRVMADFADKNRDLARIYSAEGYSGEDIDDARRLYDGEVLHTDHEIGRLLEHVEAAGLAASTVVVIASDHGESLGEHGLYFAHDFTVYEELTHVVLMMRAPGLQPGIRDDVVSLVDVTPTVCRLASLACDGPFDGRDLFDGPAGERTVFAAATPRRSKGTPFAGLEVPGLAGRWTMARHGDLKVVRIPTAAGLRFETFDLAADPFESRSLGDSAPDRGIALRGELDAWLSAMNGARPRLAVHPRRHARRRDNETLRSLGYLQ